MNEDLKIIKKKYGEKMARFCRELFPTLLETEGLLSILMLKHFEPSHDLYDDIMEQNLEGDFKNYIYSFVDVEKNNEVKEIKTPEYLLNDAGYDLYECNSEEDIQKFKKYYAKGEELCTFHGGRLDRCYVFFAVKKNVSDIKREDYPNPERQDEYGTSVLSIQFTKDESHTLSIKNRYNHHVNNPDSTYSNNLDNIIIGLTESFGKYYGLVQQHLRNEFSLDYYVLASDGKFYKYNQELNNIYYCPNNIIIDNFKVKRYDKEKYIILDYFILDLINKKIELYDKSIKESFPDIFFNIAKIEIERKEEEKEIKITLQNNNIITMALDKNNQITKLDYPKIKIIGDYFLSSNHLIHELNLPVLEKVGDGFCMFNSHLKKLNLPKLKRVGNDFLYFNVYIKELNLPSLEIGGNHFLAYNKKLLELNLPSLQKIGHDFGRFNHVLQKINCPLLEEVGADFLYCSQYVEKLSLPKLKRAGNNFMYRNECLRVVDLPFLEEVGNNFLYYNEGLQELSLPSLKSAGECFLCFNKKIYKLNLPCLQMVGNKFLYFNEDLREIIAPELREFPFPFLEDHPLISSTLRKQKSR